MEQVLSEVGVEIAGGYQWEDIPETGESLAENALLKARAVHAATGLPALADDTGLEVDALGGEPGVHSARFAGPDASYQQNVRALVDAMQGRANRRARFRTVIAVVSGSEEIIAEGELRGSIIDVPRGSRGFGYDPIFELEDGRTLAELSEEEKNQISHRGRAIRALAASVRFQGLVTGRTRRVARPERSE
jgi:XTP/dITP diphosphohydrolase